MIPIAIEKTNKIKIKRREYPKVFHHFPFIIFLLCLSEFRIPSFLSKKIYVLTAQYIEKIIPGIIKARYNKNKNIPETIQKSINFQYLVLPFLYISLKEYLSFFNEELIIPTLTNAVKNKITKLNK